MGCSFVFPDTDSDVVRRIPPVPLPTLIVCSAAFIYSTVSWFDIPWFWFFLLEEEHRKLDEPVFFLLSFPEVNNYHGSSIFRSI